MVRLGVEQFIDLVEPDVNFNSTMVRLGAFADNGEMPPSLISIPLWCGWEVALTDALESLEKYFNSTMVRLGVKFSFGSICTHIFQFHYGAVGSV